MPGLLFCLPGSRCAPEGARLSARKYWIGFNHVAGVGPARLKMLAAHFSSLEAAWNADERSLARAGLDHATVRGEAFRETVAGIESCLAAGLHTITNTTLTKENRSGALQTVEFIHELGVRSFAMNGMICAGGGRHNAQSLSESELIPLLHEVQDRASELQMRFLWYTPTEYCRLSPLELHLGAKTCNAAEYSMCIEPNGDVLPCQSYYRPVGNLLRDDWRAIWDSDLFTTLRMRREAPAEAGLPQRCWDCADLQVCGGGCPLQRAERHQEVLVHES